MAQKSKKPGRFRDRAFMQPLIFPEDFVVAGTGFEPATFGL